MLKNRGHKILFAVLLYIAAILVLLGTPPFFSNRLIHPVLHAKLVEVDTVRIERFNKWYGVESDLVKSPIVINDPKLIEQICSSLNDAKKWRPEHPNHIWQAILAIEKDNGTYYCSIGRLERNENGVAIGINSRRSWGWHLGWYRSDKLGSLVESLVDNENEK